jgi:Mrp family chromosome partitioning ATPase
MFGFVLAFIMESLDTSIGTIEDVESLLNINVLSVIPHIKFDLAKKKTSFFDKLLLKKITPPSEIEEGKVRLVSHFQPKSPAAEAYRTLRTNIQFTDQRKSLVISSAGPKEGKSSILINLGVTAAQDNYKTLLVSTDLRKPTIYHTFGLKREPGLYEVLSGSVSLEKALRSLPDFLMGKIGFDEILKTPGLDNLKILSTGYLASNPAELLSSKEMTNLIKEVRDKFDIILYDSPPILPVTDAAILGSQCDGVVLVYEVGRTARSALFRAKRQLESVGCKILGIVLNHVRQETTIDTTYHYYHYRYYGRKKEASTV